MYVKNGILYDIEMIKLEIDASEPPLTTATKSYAKMIVINKGMMIVVTIRVVLR